MSRAGLAAFVFVFVLAAGYAAAQFPYVCGDVFTKFEPCVQFIQGLQPDPTPPCCDGVLQLNEIAHWDGNSVERICRCIEFMAVGRDPPYNASWIEQLPPKCHTWLSFPISIAMDCSMF